MLTAVEFENQGLRDAAEIGEVRADPVLSAEFESSKALVAATTCVPQPWSRREAAPSSARSFVLGIDKSRASEGALTKVPLLGAAAAPFSPFQGANI